MLRYRAELHTQGALLALILVGACALKPTLAQQGEGRQWSRRGLQGGDHLTASKCHELGKEAAKEAGSVACKLLEMRCSTPPILEDPSPAAELKDLELRCRRTAETSCIAFARQLVEDEECLDLLRKGPREPVKGCEGFTEVANEFNWLVKGFCQSPAADLPPFGK